MFIQSPDSFVENRRAVAADLMELFQISPRSSKAQLNYGMFSDTMIETQSGWAPVQSLTPGQRVQTYDGSLRPIVHVEHSVTKLPTLGPVHVPGGAFAGVTEATLLPDQLILLCDDLAETVFGTPNVLVPAAALVAMPGVDLLPRDKPHSLTSIAFDDEEVIFTSGDLMVHCPAGGQSEVALIQTPASAFWDVVDLDDACALVAEIAARDHGVA